MARRVTTELYRDARVITYVALDGETIEIVSSEPGSDDLMRVSAKDRLTAANLFAQQARQRRTTPPGQPVTASVADEEIAAAAQAAFGGLDHDPFPEIRTLLEGAGLRLHHSTWSNL